LQTLYVVHALGVDTGVIAYQADSAPGHQVKAVGQEHFDPWPDNGPGCFELTSGRVAAAGGRDDQP
jgi:hypothetical protein